LESQLLPPVDLSIQVCKHLQEPRRIPFSYIFSTTNLQKSTKKLATMPTTTRNEWKQQTAPQGSVTQNPAPTRRTGGRSATRQPIIDVSDEEDEGEDEDEFLPTSRAVQRPAPTRRGSVRSSMRHLIPEDSDDEDDGSFSPTQFPSSPPVRKPGTPLPNRTRPRPDHREPSITPPTISPLSPRRNSPTPDSEDEQAKSASEPEDDSEAESEQKLTEAVRKAKAKSAKLAEATRKRWADGRMKGPMEKRAATNEAKRAAKFAAQAAKNGPGPSQATTPEDQDEVVAPFRRARRAPPSTAVEDQEEVMAPTRCGRRAPPAPITIPKYSEDEDGDKEYEEDVDEDEDADDEPNPFAPRPKDTQPEHLRTGQMPYFTPYFKKPSFVPQPPITGKEAWAVGRVWDEEKKTFVVLDEKKLAKYS
ncbi:hypothetical protein BDZ45DRAFT_765110, partial [Acephala macrosclerotiorum]